MKKKTSRAQDLKKIPIKARRERGRERVRKRDKERIFKGVTKKKKKSGDTVRT